MEGFSILDRIIRKAVMSSRLEKRACALPGETSANLIKLQELTPKLRPLHDIVKEAEEESYGLKTKGDEGNIKIYPIYANGAMVIERAFGEKGTVILDHVHREIEWLGCYLGAFKIQMSLPGKKKPRTYRVGRGGAIYVCPDTPHSVEYLEDTYMWIVKMPVGREEEGVMANNVERLD